MNTCFSNNFIESTSIYLYSALISLIKNIVSTIKEIVYGTKNERNSDVETKLSYLNIGKTNKKKEMNLINVPAKK